ncbi:MAG: glycoside hydrolase family 15 protein [Gemmataceae bacterium]|nr:glycoside hydrolase family 15 protein [Gemmataceae bacterium]MDW8265756.1 glycoside hydrolase family 15 protein [Gemmataceae bacterium]
MAVLLCDKPAPGGPGIEPRWTRSDKDGVGTAYSALSRVWFTISRGVINEIYYPTIDRPQVRDFQYLVSDGRTFFQDSRRHLRHEQDYLAPHTLGFRVISSDPQGRYRLIKETITDPHRPCLLVHTRFEVEPEWRERLRLFGLLAPHLGGSGWGNNGHVLRTDWGDILAAHKDGTWLIMAASIPFRRCSCGYVGVNDGWQDLAHNFDMDHDYDHALNGNIALTAELDLRRGNEFVLALAFGESLHAALVQLAQSLFVPFRQHRERYIEQWTRAANRCDDFLTRRQQELGISPPATGALTGDQGRLFRKSVSILLAHEDKHFEGAMIASLSIPWGEIKGDDDLGGYHLVWTRDMCQSATGLLAAGNTATPRRALIYLACTQRDDGGFYQNFWINGEAYWRGIQLDETAFPVMLAWRLLQADALGDFNPWPMVQRAAGYLIQQGPATPQERWEENSGYSPSTLAAQIAGLICAADLARRVGRPDTARFIEDYADFLESRIESWTVTTQGTLVREIPRHYIRIHPVDVDDPQPDEDPNHGVVTIRNRPPGMPANFPAKEIVDAGFLELVRYGIRKAGDPLVEDSLRVVDAVLKKDTPYGPGWHRYNHDGYGEHLDGSPFNGSGHGHLWPLLTGERGHYELAAGRAVLPYIQTMERFATASALLPEQVWSQPDRPEAFLYFGRPTGSAIPLLWAHAEYVKLVRSYAEGYVFDRLAIVADRYLGRRPDKPPLEIWKFHRQVREVRPGHVLRILARAPFRLTWSADDWATVHQTVSLDSGLRVYYVDIPVSVSQRAPVRFTFYWPEVDRWEGRDFAVAMTGG